MVNLLRHSNAKCPPGCFSISTGYIHREVASRMWHTHRSLHHRRAICARIESSPRHCVTWPGHCLVQWYLVAAKMSHVTNLVVIGLSVGYDIWLAIRWCYLLWDWIPHLHWILGNLNYTMGTYYWLKFPPFSRQPIVQPLSYTAQCLPSVRACRLPNSLSGCLQDITVVLGYHKFSLQATIDHHGPSIYSGHYTTSVNCCNRTFYCNDNKITEFDMINTKNSSTAYVVIYKLIT